MLPRITYSIKKDTDHSFPSSPPLIPLTLDLQTTQKDVEQTPFVLNNGACLTREMRFYLANGPYSDLLAKNSDCIGQADLPVGRFARLASKPADLANRSEHRQ